MIPTSFSISCLNTSDSHFLRDSSHSSLAHKFSSVLGMVSHCRRVLLHVMLR